MTLEENYSDQIKSAALTTEGALLEAPETLLGVSSSRRIQAIIFEIIIYDNFCAFNNSSVDSFRTDPKSELYPRATVSSIQPETGSQFCWILFFIIIFDVIFYNLNYNRR